MGVEGLYKNRNKSKRHALTKILIVCVLVLISMFLAFEFTLKPTISTLAEVQANWTANDAIHQAILEEVASDIRYLDLIIPHKDNENKIVFMQANIVMVNKLAAEAILKVQHRLESMRKETFEIPLGQILGSSLLATHGPKIAFKLLPIGTVNVQILDDFMQAGINQTRHKIYLNVICEMQIVFPFIATETNVETKVPIADNIIIGPVPDSYMFMDIGANARLTELEL